MAVHPAEKLEFKEKFIERYRKLTDFDEFRKYSTTFLRKAVRVNTIKKSVDEVRQRLQKEWILTPVPWCKEGFWVEHKGTQGSSGEIEKRRDIGNLPEHSLGYIYVQEAASMIPSVVLNPKPGEVVLDFCAAPGSKTTQLAQYMKNEGILFANDVNFSRIAALGINIQRCGITNAVITKMYGQYYQKTNIEFDKILVDTPCSGTGTIRKSCRVTQDWSPELVKRITGTQKLLIKTAFEKLKKGGTMVYSTCTCEPEENEGVVNYLLESCKNARLEKIELNIKRSEPVTEFDGTGYCSEVKKCLRIWPQDNDTEGFFVAKIKKS